MVVDVVAVVVVTAVVAAVIAITIVTSANPAGKPLITRIKKADLKLIGAGIYLQRLFIALPE